MTSLLATTLINRPYVAAFLIAYLVIAWRVSGPRWTFLYLLSGYSIAFASEYLSIHYGFPYGWYRYIYANLAGEWLNHGVPVWDSASYVFMNFAGLYAARSSLQRFELTGARGKIYWLILAAFMVTLLDVVVDPAAHQGEKWFLGRIYYYPEPGFYFDVTLANFAGWYLVSLVINAIGIFLINPLFSDIGKSAHRSSSTMSPDIGASTHRHINTMLILGLYYGIFAFGLGIAVYLEHWALVACDAGWIALTVGIVMAGRKN